MHDASRMMHLPITASWCALRMPVMIQLVCMGDVCLPWCTCLAMDRAQHLRTKL